ncbi:MAG TPA: DUF1800 domain-containing protein [Xanthomonadales bacterium]|nr:DUF1800 domain-containing protein [Xanthomonadales bacterium]
MRKGRFALAVLGMVLSLPAAATDLLYKAGFDEAPEGPYNEYEAARFLTQATFGPTLPEIQRLQNMGYNAWLAEQLAAAPTLHTPLLDARAALGEDVYQQVRQEAWFTRSVTANDQLRQRVAFALSEVLVVSDQNSAVDQPFALAHYYDLLLQRSFGNYRQLLRDVTLHAVMGNYLSMRGNQKEDAAENIRPDENYAREIMQLFSIGLVMLDANGTPVLSGGQPVPTYTQATIRGFARVFTGWNWSGCTASEYEWCYPGETQQAWWRQPMAPFGAYHETGSKQLLVYPGVALAGGVLPPNTGVSATTQDLDAALDNIFNHPNVGPFVAKRLIERLVTSNPSPAYVGRVAAKFANNGSGVRGDLAAVVRQVLMDPEARNRAAMPANGGKLREPLLRVTQLWRALDARSVDNRYREGWPEYYGGQAALRSPTVFNFFLPSYSLPGEIATLGLVSPEFQISTDTFITRLTNEIAGKVYWFWRGNPDLSPEDVTVDLARDMPLANTPSRLVERYDLLFMGGAMSAPMRTIVLNDLNQIDLADGDDARRERVQDALWLILNSPEYVVEK